MQHINTVTKFEQNYFDRSTVVIDRAGVDPLSILGVDLLDDEIAQFAGAPTGSKVTLLHNATWPQPGDERVPPGLYFVVESKYVESYNVIGIYTLPSVAGNPQQYGVYIKWVDFLRSAPTPRGMAARMLAIIVRQAWQLENATEIRLWAAGGRDWRDKKPGERWGGYYAWPKYGFDMPLDANDHTIARYFPYYPCERDNALNPLVLLSHCTSVLDVFNLDGGSEYWKSAGNGDYMVFDLALASRSVNKLDEALHGR